MPINLFNNPLSSIKLGVNDILKGYIGNDEIFPNLITIEFTSISGLGLTYTLPPSQTGDPGASYPSTTFTISGAASEILQVSSFAMTNLPSTLSAVVSSGGNTNSLTVTISGTFPTVGVGAITSVVSGITISTAYLAHFLMVGGGGSAGSAYVSAGGGGGGVRTSFAPNGGGQSVDTQPTLIPGTTYTVTVAAIGGDSTISGSPFNNIVATRGNNGGGSTANTVNGPSAGSYGYSGGGSNASSYAAGGGGGAGGPGNSSSSYGTGGFNGGAPVINAITGSNVNYGSGGRGYTGNYGAGSSTASAYGKGGDASGGVGQPGVVILRVPTVSVGTASGTHTTGTTNGGTETWIQWTGSGSYTA